jgi:hypothetical protein
VGRHTVPGSGKPTPDQGFWVRLAAAGVALLLVAGYLLTRGGDDGTTTATVPRAARTSAPATSTPPPSTAASTSPAASAPAPSASPTAPAATRRPPTLSFVVRRASFITVRVPGGRTIVSRLFRKGQERSFDQRVLEVVNGRPSAVVFTVNGKRRNPGPADEPETFTVRRR